MQKGRLRTQRGIKSKDIGQFSPKKLSGLTIYLNLVSSYSSMHTTPTSYKEGSRKTERWTLRRMGARRKYGRQPTCPLEPPSWTVPELGEQYPGEGCLGHSPLLLPGGTKSFLVSETAILAVTSHVYPSYARTEAPEHSTHRGP